MLQVIFEAFSTLLSDKKTFEDAAPAYENALGHSNFSHRLEYIPHETQRFPAGTGNATSSGSTPLSDKHNNKRIACSFLHLVDTHFPAGHKLPKIFNRNTVKVSYSCMEQEKTRHKLLVQTTCRKEAWPLLNKCMNKDIVYTATISTSDTNDTMTIE